jgi:predicted nucleotidyltransferase
VYGDRPDPVDAARSFVTARHPEARAAFLGGSVITPDRTPTSDLDVVVVVAGPPAPYRETLEHEGWVVEQFVHTRETLEDFWSSDEERRVCSLLRMCADSVVLADDGGTAEEIRSVAAGRIAAGPPPLTEPELDALRYGLTDVLDDMAGCDREHELAYLAGAVLERTSALALAAAGRWSGSGKALARELHRTEPDLVERLVDGHRHVVVYGDTAVLHRAAVDVLMRVGGPLLTGYRASGEPRADR